MAFLGLFGGVFGCLFAAAQVHATTIGLTLSSDKDPATVSNGESITFTVGVDPESVITGYTLDIYYDTAQLEFVSSAELALWEVVIPNVGTFGVPVAYLQDPATTGIYGLAGSSGLASSDSGRVSVFQTSDSLPTTDLFGLTFNVVSSVPNGITDLRVGIFDTGYDGVTSPTDSFTVDPNAVAASIGVVPVPAAGILLLSGIGFFALISRRRNTT